MTDLILDTLLATEREGWDALCESRGGAFYADLMTADGLMIISNGMVLDRAAVEASLNDAPVWDSYEITDARLVPLGDDTAALVYHARSVRGDEGPFVATMGSVYRVIEGRLRLALYQQSVVPG